MAAGVETLEGWDAFLKEAVTAALPKKKGLVAPIVFFIKECTPSVYALQLHTDADDKYPGFYSDSLRYKFQGLTPDEADKITLAVAKGAGAHKEAVSARAKAAGVDAPRLVDYSQFKGATKFERVVEAVRAMTGQDIESPLMFALQGKSDPLFYTHFTYGRKDVTVTQREVDSWVYRRLNDLPDVVRTMTARVIYDLLFGPAAALPPKGN